MNVLFLTLLSFDSLQERNIYTDLLREFVKNGHCVYVVSPFEKRQQQSTRLIVEEKTTILRLRIGNTQKTNIIEKGISTVMIEPTFKKAIKHYFSDIKFDLVLYSTPPITLVGAIEYVKNRDGAKTYLLLKDIFPQNAVDLEMMSTSGFKGLLYKYFRKKEKKLYQISDRIGCMSEANVKYVVNHNSDINPEIVEVCPNSISIIDKSVDTVTREQIRKKYDIPLEKKVFVYGGNLGKPQGIPFLIDCLEKCSAIESAFFLIVGDGTEYSMLDDYVHRSKQTNLKLMKHLPKEEYDTMVGACDVGLLFLDHRFTIPNFPSRLLTYLQAKLPVVAATDSNTDIGKIITIGKFGWWCESNDPNEFYSIISKISCEDTCDAGLVGFEYLKKHFSVEDACRVIVNGKVTY